MAPPAARQTRSGHLAMLALAARTRRAMETTRRRVGARVAARRPRRDDIPALGVTAAVVGIILNLAVWFAWHVVRPADGVIRGCSAARGTATR